MSVRQATPEDREVLQELVLRFREEVRRYRPSSTRSLSPADAQAKGWITESPAGEEFRSFIASASHRAGD